MKSNDHYLIEAAEKHMQQFELKGFKNMFKSLHKTFDEAMTNLRKDIEKPKVQKNSITILDYKNGKVACYEIEDEDAEEFLIDKGYDTSNIHYIVTNVLKLEINSDVD